MKTSRHTKGCSSQTTGLIPPDSRNNIGILRLRRIERVLPSNHSIPAKPLTIYNTSSTKAPLPKGVKINRNINSLIESKRRSSLVNINYKTQDHEKLANTREGEKSCNSSQIFESSNQKHSFIQHDFISLLTIYNHCSDRPYALGL